MHSPVSHPVPALLYPTCLLGYQGFVAGRSWPRPHSLAKMTHMFSILPQIWCTTAHCIAMLLDCSKSAAGRQPWERSTARLCMQCSECTSCCVVSLRSRSSCLMRILICSKPRCWPCCWDWRQRRCYRRLGRGCSRSQHLPANTASGQRLWSSVLSLTMPSHNADASHMSWVDPTECA